MVAAADHFYLGRPGAPAAAPRKATLTKRGLNSLNSETGSVNAIFASTRGADWLNAAISLRHDAHAHNTENPPQHVLQYSTSLQYHEYNGALERAARHALLLRLLLLFPTLDACLVASAAIISLHAATASYMPPISAAIASVVLS